MSYNTLSGIKGGTYNYHIELSLIVTEDRSAVNKGIRQQTMNK